MSQVTEDILNSGIPVLSAGNTVESLGSVDRDVVAGLPSAADLDAVAEEQAIAEATGAPSTVTEAISPEEFLDEENTFDVSRAEFTELQDAFLRLYNSVIAFNKTSPHKILGVV